MVSKGDLQTFAIEVSLEVRSSWSMIMPSKIDIFSQTGMCFGFFSKWQLNQNIQRVFFLLLFVVCLLLNTQNTNTGEKEIHLRCALICGLWVIVSKWVMSEFFKCIFFGTCNQNSPLTWVKGTAAHVCFVSFRLTGRDIFSPLLMALCHICRPCIFFSSMSLGLLALRWCSGLTGVFEATAGPGRPWDRKAGKGNLGVRDEPLLGVSPFLKNPEWAGPRVSSCTTLTIPRTGSSGPPPDDSNSTRDPLTTLSKILWGNVRATAVQVDKRIRLTEKAIVSRQKR